MTLDGLENEIIHITINHQVTPRTRARIRNTICEAIQQQLELCYGWDNAPEFTLEWL